MSLCALEQSGLHYELRLVNLAAGEQTQSEYSRFNPLRKVPALLIDERLLTENVAIISYIAAMVPAAKLFPTANSPLDLAERFSGLSFCSATLHPLVRGMANPQRITNGDGEPVRSKALSAAQVPFRYAEQRLQDNGWWLGVWSIIDVYLSWACSVASLGTFDFSSYPALTDLDARLAHHPAFRRMNEVNAEARKSLGI